MGLREGSERGAVPSWGRGAQEAGGGVEGIPAANWGLDGTNCPSSQKGIVFHVEGKERFAYKLGCKLQRRNPVLPGLQPGRQRDATRDPKAAFLPVALQAPEAVISAHCLCRFSLEKPCAVAACGVSPSPSEDWILSIEARVVSALAEVRLALLQAVPTQRPQGRSSVFCYLEQQSPFTPRPHPQK